MKRILTIAALLSALCVNGQSKFNVSEKHNKEMDSILRTATYDPYNYQFTVNYGVYKNIVPCEGGYMMYDWNDEKYLIKKNSVYYTWIENKKNNSK